jgi:hypothetical protein
MFQTLFEHSDDWLKYTIGLLHLHKTNDELTQLKAAALADSRIQAFLHDVEHFHATLVTTHKNPVLPVNKLLFLLDLGFGTDIPQIQTAVDEILRHHDENGVYQSMTNVPKHFGGAGVDVFSWCLCDAPRLLLALLKAGVDIQTHIKPGVDYLISLIRENGFPCAVSPELGTFRGPGRKDDCCPFATLIMAELLSYLPEYMDSSAADTAVTALLSLWENSLGQHPYMFYMGTDFRKLKAPSCWYDIVSVCGVISRFPKAVRDPRFHQMLDVIRDKRDENGFFTPESVYIKMKDWDFGQKKAPSPYLTYLCLRIFEQSQAL